VQLVVLAAGLGTRFGGVKQLAAVGPRGEAIMDVLLARAGASGFADAVVVIRPEIESDVVDHFAAHPSALPVRVVHQSVPSDRQKPLGTADAVLQCRAEITETFVVVNADDLYPLRAFELLASHLSSSDEHGLIAFRLRNTVISDRPVSRAVLSFDATHQLRTIDERRSIEPAAVSGDDWVSMNMWGFQHSIIDDLAGAVERFLADGANGEVLLPDVVAELVRAGARVRVIPCEEPCIGVTYAEDVSTVRDALT
jgi:bifunctional N-acetylglucosamine-1-phosphate-uridyltransferase/glucosamine-1-phosphate-acetyltransferase GlmU-like protein